jgi:hypothetical protein
MGGVVKDQYALNFSGPIFWQVVRTPPARRDPRALKQAILVLDQYLDIAEKRLADASYLCGSDFTLADVQFGHLLYRYFTIEIERRERAGLSAYYERLVARPAYREHVMVPYDELAWSRNGRRQSRAFCGLSSCAMGERKGGRLLDSCRSLLCRWAS